MTLKSSRNTVNSAPRMETVSGVMNFLTALWLFSLGASTGRRGKSENDFCFNSYEMS